MVLDEAVDQGGDHLVVQLLGGVALLGAHQAEGLEVLMDEELDEQGAPQEEGHLGGNDLEYEKKSFHSR